MRVFGSWWERLPVREAVPKLLVIAVVLAFVAQPGAISDVFRTVGWIWG